jgi:hypothetical protein
MSGALSGFELTSETPTINRLPACIDFDVQGVGLFRPTTIDRAGHGGPRTDVGCGGVNPR